jgi:hypothetical protein
MGAGVNQLYPFCKKPSARMMNFAENFFHGNNISLSALM